MPELNDYSGPLKPDVRFEDFSKEALVKLLYAYAAAYGRAGGVYNGIIRERYGDEEAWRYTVEYWMRVGPIANRLICDALNIKPGTIEALLKSLQLDPGWPPQLFGLAGEDQRAASHMELTDESHGTFTLQRCVALEGAEQRGLEGVMRTCHAVEYSTFMEYARMAHNPNIKCRALKLAPRKSRDEKPACKWEYWID